MNNVALSIVGSLPALWVGALVLLLMACVAAAVAVLKDASRITAERRSILDALKEAQQSGLLPNARITADAVQRIEAVTGGVLLWVHHPEMTRYSARVDVTTNRLLLSDRPPQFDQLVKQFPLGLFAGSFTALGLLGTFYGLIQATSAFDTGGTTEQLTAQIDGFVSGLDAAYGTSVVGMFIALLLTVSVSLVRLWAGGKGREQEAELQQVAQLAAPQEELRTELVAKFAGLDSMATTIPALVKAADAMGKFGESFSPEALAKTITSALDRQLSPVMKELTDEVRNLRNEKKQGEAEMLRVMLSELRTQVLEPMAAQVMESSTRVQELTTVVIDLSDTVKTSNEQMLAMTETMDKFQTDTLERLGQFSSDLDSRLAGFATSLGDRLDNFTNSLGQKNDAFTSGLNTLFSDFTRDSKAVFAEIPANVQTALGQVREEIRVILTQSTDTQREMLDSTRVAFTNQSRQFKEFVIEANGTLKTIQDQTVKLIAEQTASQREVLNSLRSNVEETLERARTAFEETATSQQTALRAMNEELVSQFRQLDQLFTAQQENLRQVAEETAATMSQARKDLEQGIHVIPQMLETARKEGQAQLQLFQDAVLQQMTTFGENYQTELRQFFEQQTVLLEATLGEQRKGLERVVVGLNESFESEYARRKELGEELNGALGTLTDQIADTQSIQLRLQEFAAEPMVQVNAALSELNHIQTSLVKQMADTQRTFSEMQRSNVDFYTSLSEQYRKSLEALDTRTDNANRELDQNITQVCKYLTSAANQLATAAALRQEKRP